MTRSVAFTLLMLSIPYLNAQQDDNDGPLRGILATSVTASGSVTTVQDRIAFDAAAVADDPRIVTRDVQEMRWSGLILIRDAVPFQLHAEIAGQLTIRIDDEVVFRADSSTKQFVSGALTRVETGDHSITAEFTPADSGFLRLFWSSEAFTLEPLPPDVFFVEDAHTYLAVDRGRVLADALRCAACHDDLGVSEIVDAPALDRVRGSQPVAALIRRLLNPRTVVADSRMPAFGLSRDEAQSVAAFLLEVSQPEPELTRVTWKTDAVDAGRQLLQSVGCAACHVLPRDTEGLTEITGDYSGPELASIRSRRTPEWVSQWLRQPESLNPRHRMPVFDLNNDERRQIVAALFADAAASPSAAAEADIVTPERVAAGEKLVRDLNCAACHQIPGVQKGPDPESREQSAACIAATRENHDPQPHFVIDPAERRLLTAWIAAARRDGIRSSAAGSGDLLLRRKGCLACHDRDLSRGLSAHAAVLEQAHPALRGTAQAMIPPPLTAAGDRLRDEFLRDAVSGRQKSRRLPWLHVRMPRYAHSEADRDQLVEHLVAVDRIPDDADAVRQDIFVGLDPDAVEPPSESELLTGNQLIGALGFNCVACHSAGRFAPRNVALGTRGSDIMTMGNRIRTRFFLRWMKNPIRVVSGIEMPAIRRAAPGVAGESLPHQIALMWRSLRDPRFTPPTVTSQYEQFLSVRKSEPPRIVRDVFTVGEGDQLIPVARALAIGFGNGHSLLLDLDTLRWMQWTYGDFARQRTEGKSWYWDMAGVPVADHGETPPMFAAVRPDGTRLEPVIDEARIAELVEYRTEDDAVEIHVRLHMRAASASTAEAEPHPHADFSHWFAPQSPTTPVDLWFTARAAASTDSGDGWQISVRRGEHPPELTLFVQNLVGLDAASGQGVIRQDGRLAARTVQELPVGESLSLTAVIPAERVGGRLPVIAPVTQNAEEVTALPGYVGMRLPLDASIMPTSIATLPDGRLAFTSLKGHVWTAADTNADGLHDSLHLIEEGLASPFGILAQDDSLIVAHKPEVLELRDADGDGRTDVRRVIAAGWGFSDNYHDWSTGLVRDREGNLFVGLGSDYSDRKRSQQRDRWRGGIVQVNSAGHVSPVAMAFRYPMGLAIDREGNLFATDNQGVQNTFNEINLIEQGGRYGVPSRFDEADASDHALPALAVPHPWARSVNSILFFPDDYPVESLRGHGLGCEYDNRFLMRFTTQQVNGEIQGCSYPFSLHNQGGGGTNFIGPICSHLADDGTLYIGSIWDSGWQGGRNTGGITRLTPDPAGLPNGIREVRATATGFEVEFFADVPKTAAANPESWSVRSYTREWSGQYASPDSDERIRSPAAVRPTADGRTIRLDVPDLQDAHMYHIVLRESDDAPEPLWPAEAYYWMRRVPK